jgi:hypothetical protein
MREHHLQRACWQFQILDAAEMIGHPAINRLGPCFLSFPSFLGGEYRLNYLSKVASFFGKIVLSFCLFWVVNIRFNHWTTSEWCAPHESRRADQFMADPLWVTNPGV